jgi:hypothetical protein
MAAPQSVRRKIKGTCGLDEPSQLKYANLIYIDCLILDTGIWEHGRKYVLGVCGHICLAVFMFHNGSLLFSFGMSDRVNMWRFLVLESVLDIVVYRDLIQKDGMQLHDVCFEFFQGLQFPASGRAVRMISYMNW